MRPLGPDDRVFVGRRHGNGRVETKAADAEDVGLEVTNLDRELVRNAVRDSGRKLDHDAHRLVFDCV